MYMAQDTNLVTALLSLDGSNTALSLTSNITRTPDTWQHFALERDLSNVVRLYIDGAVVAQGNLSGTLFNNDPNPLIYGAGPTYLFSVAAGWRIDEVRITKDKAQYEGAFTPPTTPFPRFDVMPVTAFINSNTDFIKANVGTGERLLTSDAVTFDANGGDGGGVLYGFTFLHTLANVVGPNISLSNAQGSNITVSATADSGNVATANVVTTALDPTGFLTTIINPVSLTWTAA
jgi:hypothetical protein